MSRHHSGAENMPTILKHIAVEAETIAVFESIATLAAYNERVLVKNAIYVKIGFWYADFDLLRLANGFLCTVKRISKAKLWLANIHLRFNFIVLRGKLMEFVNLDCSKKRCLEIKHFLTACKRTF